MRCPWLRVVAVWAMREGSARASERPALAAILSGNGFQPKEWSARGGGEMQLGKC